MLPGEQGLPEAIFASDGQIVNRLFAALSREAGQRLGCSLKEQLQILQIAVDIWQTSSEFALSLLFKSDLDSQSLARTETEDISLKLQAVCPSGPLSKLRLFIPAMERPFRTYKFTANP